MIKMLKGGQIRVAIMKEKSNLKTIPLVSCLQDN